MESRVVGGAGIGDVQAVETAFPDDATREDDLFVQSLTVGPEHYESAVSENDRVGERTICRHAGGDAVKVVAGAGGNVVSSDFRPAGPNFRPEQPQTHGDEAVVKMRQHEVVAPVSKALIEGNRANCTSVRVLQPREAFTPSRGVEGW